MPSKDSLVFVALGGLDEVGLNLALYGYGPKAKRQWLMVDCGVSFAGDDVPGVDLIMPDVTFVEEQGGNLAGIVITHAHEDHIGALAELWPRLGAPVFATPFAAQLLEVRRLSEQGAPKIPLHVVEQGATVQIGPFNVEFVPVAHSIPESNALAIRTPAGLVVHTGDWKIDPDPRIGLKTDEARFRALGEEGVLALVCDSTNILREGVSPSEGEVAVHLSELIKNAPARVAVTTFASNVARLRTVAEAAYACGREVVVVGRAMDRVIEVARERGFLDGLPDFRSQETYGYLPRDKVVALLTGSQGEKRAALARIANDDHPEIALSAGDRVIFSSRTIPGNEREVNHIINALVAQGIEVITDRAGLVHASGHPRRGEVTQMYDWVKPQIAIPAHGEPQHRVEHAAFARARSVPHVLTPGNGDMVLLGPDKPAMLGPVPHGRLYKDGHMLIEAASSAIQERKRLSFAGIVTVAVSIDEQGEIVADPIIRLTGLPEKTRKGELLVDFVADLVDDVLDGLTKPRRRDPDSVETAVTKAIRHSIQTIWGKKPVCQVMVMPV